MHAGIITGGGKGKKLLACGLVWGTAFSGAPSRAAELASPLQAFLLFWLGFLGLLCCCCQQGAIELLPLWSVLC